MSMYAEYIKEHRGDEMIENECGFASYRFLNEMKSVYIIDIYVKPQHRKDKIASILADEVVSIAKSKGCVELLGTVVPTANNSTSSLKVLLGYNMKLKSCSNDMIIFSKEI